MNKTARLNTDIESVEGYVTAVIKEGLRYSGLNGRWRIHCMLDRAQVQSKNDSLTFSEQVDRMLKNIISYFERQEELSGEMHDFLGYLENTIYEHPQN